MITVPCNCPKIDTLSFCFGITNLRNWTKRLMFYIVFVTKSFIIFNPLNANPEKWSNTLEQIVGNLPTICLSVFDHFMNLALKGLTFTFRRPLVN